MDVKGDSECPADVSLLGLRIVNGFCRFIVLRVGPFEIFDIFVRAFKITLNSGRGW